jgi:hypothetical protein
MTIVGADADAGDGGVPHGEVLRRFALAVAAHDDPTDIAVARDAVRDAVGPAGLGDACGVIANFDGITRVADATGTEVDEMMVEGVAAGILGEFDTSHLQALD